MLSTTLFTSLPNNIIATAAEKNTIDEETFLVETGEELSSEEVIHLLESIDNDDMIFISEDVEGLDREPISELWDEPVHLEREYYSNPSEFNTQLHFELFNANVVNQMDWAVIAALMKGTWWIPGVGKVVIVAAGIYIGGKLLAAVAKPLIQKAKIWLAKRAHKKQVDTAVNNLSSNNRTHIMNNTGHKWNSMFPGPNNNNKWEQIKKVIKQVMMDGNETKYGSAFKRTLRVNGRTVEVTFQKLGKGIIRISNGWVK